MIEEGIDSYTFAQKERLVFIDLCLLFFGEISRTTLSNYFSIKSAACTRDIAAYKKLAPDNLVLMHQTKHYHITDKFKPLFVHKPSEALLKLSEIHHLINQNSEGVGESLIDVIKFPLPSTENLALITQAVVQKYQIECEYCSISSGFSVRKIFPHSFAFNGLRWHVRAYDSNTNSFRDFVCNRLDKLTLVRIKPNYDESNANDNEWNLRVNLKLIPHPKLVHNVAVVKDFNMVNGCLNVETRAALAGYVLNRLSVDCSTDFSLDARTYQLALANRKDLSSIVNLNIAPGYE